jgi:hypothetical protein
MELSKRASRAICLLRRVTKGKGTTRTVDLRGQREKVKGLDHNEEKKVRRLGGSESRASLIYVGTFSSRSVGRS